RACSTSSRRAPPGCTERGALFAAASGDELAQVGGQLAAHVAQLALAHEGLERVADALDEVGGLVKGQAEAPGDLLVEGGAGDGAVGAAAAAELEVLLHRARQLRDEVVGL